MYFFGWSDERFLLTTPWSRVCWRARSNLLVCLPRTNFWHFVPELLRIELATRFGAEMAGGFGYSAPHADSTCGSFSNRSARESRGRIGAARTALRTANPCGPGMVRVASRVD